MSEQSYLSEAIRAARRRAGLSQAELAELLGVRQSSVSQWERGSTRPSTVHLLALTAALKCSLLDFPGAGGDGAGTSAGQDGAGAGDGAEAFEQAGRAAESVS
jgi:transcriptional regulator with XRE-family HTH domain